MADTPLTLAETASVFGEMLTFQALLDAETDPPAPRCMLAGKVEDMMNTVVRQIAFYEFERRLHDARRKRRADARRASARSGWRCRRESLGPAFDFTTSTQVYWTYIPHFIHVAVLRLCLCLRRLPGELALRRLPGGHRRASSRSYLEMLAAGGTMRHKELLAPFGLDAADPAFWGKGLGVIAGLHRRARGSAARWRA